jgi:hypothetical protein
MKKTIGKILMLSLIITGSTQAAQFICRDESGLHHVQPQFVDKTLREIPDDKLEEVLPYIAIYPVKMNNGEYMLRAHVRGLGGGAGGATVGFWVGRFVGQTVGYGLVAVVAAPAALAGPTAYAVAVAGLAGTCAPVIESASTLTSLGGALLGGAMTGPM